MALESDDNYYKTLSWLISKAVLSENTEQLAFHLTNHTKQLISYDQALLWQEGLNGCHIIAVSGVSVVNHSALYIRLWEKQLLPKIMVENGVVAFLTLDKYQKELASYKGEVYLHACSMIFYNQQRKAGLILLSSTPWSEDIMEKIKKLAIVYGHIWKLYNFHKKSPFEMIKKLRKSKKIVLTALIIILLLPIRESVLVPAEIAPKSPTVVASSIKGMIKEIYVLPNQVVKANQPLFKLDTISLENKYEQAIKSLDVAKEKYRKGYQQSYSNPEAKTELRILSDQIKISEIELNYSKLLLERAVVKSDFAGTVIFSDPKNWLGRPVEIGERVMLLADENKKQLEVFLPIDDLIVIPHSAEVIFYPNPKPLSTIKARINFISKHAEVQPDDKLAYYGVADFQDSKGMQEQFGIKGTAKIYGNRVFVVYYLLRKPLSWLRRTIGI